MLRLILVSLIGSASLAAAQSYSSSSYRKSQFQKAEGYDKAYLVDKCEDDYGRKTSTIGYTTTTKVVVKTYTSTRTAYKVALETAHGVARHKRAAQATPSTTAQKKKEVDTIYANIKKASSSDLKSLCAGITTRKVTKTYTTTATNSQRAVATQRIAPKYVVCPTFNDGNQLINVYTWAQTYTLSCQYGQPQDSASLFVTYTCYYDTSSGRLTLDTGDTIGAGKCPDTFTPTPKTSGDMCAYIGSCPSGGPGYDNAVLVSQYYTSRGWITLLDCRNSTTCQSCQYNADSRGFYGAGEAPHCTATAPASKACPDRLAANYEKGYCSFPNGYPSYN